MAVYGRRRVDKTKTVLRFISDKKNAIYFQPAEIARLCHMEPKNIYAYLSKLEDLELISIINNPLSGKNKNKTILY